MIKKFFLFLLLLFLVVIGIVLFNTFRFQPNQQAVESVPAPELTEASLQHFQQALSYKTISYGDPSLFDSTQFIGLRQFLESTYPKAHQVLTREIVAGYSLLYKWEGKNADLKPVVLMAHQDVVPIEEATKSMWTVDPFAGVIKDNFIWGRGTTDDKINVVSIMETVEKLVSENFQPERTVYIVFGHDEEIGGKGATAIAKLLKDRNIAAEFVLDEGGLITAEKVPGMTKPIALLGTAEKGYLSLKLTVSLPGGHSSMPEKETAIDVLAKALNTLRSKPFEPEFSEPMHGLMESLGPEMPFVQRMAFANPWLFKKMILSTYSQSNTGDAMIRTTIVPTIIEAGIKDNVVPTVATAVVNFRLLPGHTSDQVIEEVKKKINDERVNVAPLNKNVSEPSPVTPINGFGYQKIAGTIKKSYPQVITSPFLVIGATDSRHFTEVSSNIIKFSPMIDPIGFHGIDERVSLESYKTALWFYEQLLRDLN
ncbi:MAG: M20 family peptidase [Cyclobacteriaceae bacterium]|nr:M20 family peptidase [Cyclobacteriaceae bacterium]UYN86865.1 MAG: M20 family peptidase [Cyclobacteriaceae bacterium]